MRRFILRRVAALAATLFFVSVLVFVLIIMGTEASPEAAARLREAMGLNRSLPVQYAEWIGGALRGDLGRSIQYDVPVGALILSRLPGTVPLPLMGAFLLA